MEKGDGGENTHTSRLFSRWQVGELHSPSIVALSVALTIAVARRPSQGAKVPGWAHLPRGVGRHERQAVTPPPDEDVVSAAGPANLVLAFVGRDDAAHALLLRWRHLEVGRVSMDMIKIVPTQIVQSVPI